MDKEDERRPTIFKKNSREIVGELEKIRKSDPMAPFELNTPRDVQVSIRPKENIPPAIFRPDPLIPGGFLANPLTIRALRKEIFVAGADFEELTAPYTCQKCKNQMDLQFWHFCPFCEAPFIT